MFRRYRNNVRIRDQRLSGKLRYIPPEKPILEGKLFSKKIPMRRLRIKESNIPTDIQNIQTNVPDINMKNSYLRGHGAPHRLPGVRRWEQEYSTGPLVYTPYYNNIGYSFPC